MQIRALLMAAVAISILGACSKAATSVPNPTAIQTAEIDQAKICIAAGATKDDVLFCKPGEKVFFSPLSWGNEQYPVRFAAFFCDLRYEVVITNGGVACIFADPPGIQPLAPEES